VCVFSQLFVIIFTTPDFYEAWKYIPLLTIGVIFSNMSALVGSNFSATKESKYYFLSCVWGGLVSIIFNFLFIPRIGIWGACIAIVLSHIVAATTRVIYSWKYNKIRNIPFYIVIFSLGMTAIFVSFFIELLILRIMIFIIIIFLILFLNRKELKLIIYQIKRETLSR
jgi:O-antigen/teichoic acid export membrane protein